jgi:anti-anti-sigma factor
MELFVEEFEVDGAVVKMAGRLDLAGVQEIDLPISVASGKYKKLIIEMIDVDFISSLGLRLIITTARAVAAKGGRLVLAAPQLAVANVLQVSGFDKLISIASDADAARALLV